MAILNFPPNPTIGQSYKLGGKTYYWTGQAWIVGPSAGNFTTITGTNLVLTSTTNAVSLSTGGTLTVLGGAAIGGDLILGGRLYGLSTGTGGLGGLSEISAITATFQQLYVTGGIEATTTNSGSLQVHGGLGVSGNIYMGGTLFSGGAPVLTTSSFGTLIEQGDDIEVQDLGGGVTRFNNTSTLQTVTTRGSTTTHSIRILNATSSTNTITGALVVSGGVGVGGRVNSESIRIADTVFDSTVQTVNSMLATVIDEFSFNEYRSAKYLIQIDEGSSPSHRCQITELLALVSNTGTVILTEYGSVMTDTDLGNFDAMVTAFGSDTVVRLYFLAMDTTPKTIKVMRTAMAK